MAKYSQINSFNALQTFTVGSQTYQIFSLAQATQALGDISKLPKSLKVLLENLLRFEDGVTVKHEDIQAMLQEGSSSGVIEHTEHTMVKNVFRLDERTISSLMVPRSDIVFLDIELTLEENLHRVMQSPHSRFPVCEGHADELIGVVSAKQMLAQSVAGKLTDLRALAQPCNFVPDSLTGMELLEHFRSTGSQMVFVVDEYGDLKGLVTLQDLMEALTGEFNEADAEEGDLMIVQRDDGLLS